PRHGEFMADGDLEIAVDTEAQTLLELRQDRDLPQRPGEAVEQESVGDRRLEGLLEQLADQRVGDEFAPLQELFNPAPERIATAGPIPEALSRMSLAGSNSC